MNRARNLRWRKNEVDGRRIQGQGAANKERQLRRASASASQCRCDPRPMRARCTSARRKVGRASFWGRYHAFLRIRSLRPNAINEIQLNRGLRTLVRTQHSIKLPIYCHFLKRQIQLPRELMPSTVQVFLGKLSTL